MPDGELVYAIEQRMHLIPRACLNSLTHLVMVITHLYMFRQTNVITFHFDYCCALLIIASHTAISGWSTA